MPAQPTNTPPSGGSWRWSPESGWTAMPPEAEAETPQPQPASTPPAATE